MALTVKMLKGLGLTDEQREAILEEHANTVNEIKAERDRLKADAEKLPGVQRQLEELQAAGDGGYKQKYEKEHKAFEDYKSDIAAKQTKAAKEKAVRAYFESKNITGANLDLAMRGCGEEMNVLEMDGDKIKDPSSLDALISGTYKSLVSTTSTKGSNPANPPANTGGGAMTKDQIFAIKDRTARRAAIRENIELFENTNGG